MRRKEVCIHNIDVNKDCDDCENIVLEYERNLLLEESLRGLNESL